jgi:uncharacterized iron-regulated membrane protein
VSLVSKADNATPPQYHLKARTTEPRQLDAMIRAAAQGEPHTHLQGLMYPSADQPLTVMLARAEIDDFSHTTYVYLDPANGKRLGAWRVGRNRTWGDSFVWLLAPLHFGTYWGLGVKVLWAILGLSLPVLAISGLLMYWNRYLSKLWRSWRAKTSLTSA